MVPLSLHSVCKCLFLSTFINTDVICPTEFVVRALTQLNEPCETYHRDHLMSRYQGNNNSITSEEQSHGQIVIDSPCIGGGPAQITEQYFSSLSHPSASSSSTSTSHPLAATVDCSFINMLSHGTIQVLPAPSSSSSSSTGSNRVAVLLHSLPDKLHSSCIDHNSSCPLTDHDDLHACHFASTMMQETSLCDMNNPNPLGLVSADGVNSDCHQLATIPEEQNCFTNALPPLRRDCNGDSRVYLSGDNSHTLSSAHDNTSSSYCESSATSTASSDPTTGGGVSCYLLDESTMVIIDSTFYLRRFTSSHSLSHPANAFSLSSSLYFS